MQINFAHFDGTENWVFPIIVILEFIVFHFERKNRKQCPYYLLARVIYYNKTYTVLSMQPMYFYNIDVNTRMCVACEKKLSFSRKMVQHIFQAVIVDFVHKHRIHSVVATQHNKRILSIVSNCEL